MKLNQSMSILFWLYKQKADDSGVAPIYCRITLGETRTQFSTSKKVHPDFWNSTANKVSIKCPNAAAINEDLDGIKGDLRKIFNQLTATHEAVTGEMVKNAFTGKGQEKKTVKELFDIYIAFYKQKVDQKKASYRTLQKFKTIQSKLGDFFIKEFRLSDKPLCELKASFAENFMHFLSVNEKLLKTQ